MDEVAAAMELFAEGDTSTAKQQLLKLAKQHPRSQTVLLTLLELCQKIQDWHTFAYYSEQLLSQERGQDRAETLNNLTFAHIQLMYPALAWYFAQELLQHHPEFEHIEQIKTLVAKTTPLLLEEADETPGMAAFSQQEKLELRVLHDRIRFLTESGHSAEAIDAAEKFLVKVPDMLPILNNLSLSQFMVGNVQQAINTAEKVLTQDSNNFHALGNLVRYHVLIAQFDQAQTYGARLQQIASDNPDLEIKQAEAFAFLGNDEQVWAAYERAKTRLDKLPPLLLHQAATASYRQGDEKTAWKLWQQAKKQVPTFEMAQDCLAEKRWPIAERNIPWYWPFQYWFPQDFEQLLTKHLGVSLQRMNDKSVDRAMKALLAERPYLPQLFPHLLEYGDRHTREFVLNFIRIVKTPDMLQTLYDFAQSRYGSDDLRLEAVQFISQNYPAMLPEDKQVPLWVNGQQTEMFMLGFEITDEPEWIEGVSEETLIKYEAAHDLLMEGKPKEAEVLLHEIIAEAPHFYSAYNQLSVAYERQGRSAEARQLVEETHQRFPDYFFARIALARIAVQEKQIEKARELIQPLLRLARLHISEFRALAQAQMDIALAEGKPEAARTWLDMWQQLEEDNPELVPWHLRINGPGKLGRGLQKLLGRS